LESQVRQGKLRFSNAVEGAEKAELLRDEADGEQVVPKSEVPRMVGQVQQI
jgi:hypothetical protein